MATVEQPTTLVSLTPVAADKIKSLLAEEAEGEVGVLRVAIQGGGCSGFSAPYLKGATVDFLNTISESGFKIDNPNAAASCGCGHSFTVEEGAEAAPDTHAGGCGSGCSH